MQREEVHHDLVDVATEGVLVHGLGRADAMHHHVGDVVFADVRQHLVVEKSARDVVDEVGAFVDAGFSDIFPERVDGNQSVGEGLSDGFQDGDDALHFLALGGNGVVGPCGTTADVDEVGAVGNHLFAMVQGLARLVETPTVGKRVRRDVKDAHDGRAVEKYGFVLSIEFQHGAFLAKLHIFLKMASDAHFCVLGKNNTP